MESGSPALTAEAGPTPTSHTYLSQVRLEEGQGLLLLGSEGEDLEAGRGG